MLSSGLLTRPLATALRVALLTIFLLTVSPATASAHADILSSSPTPGQVLTAPPSVIELTFNEDVSPLTSAFELRSSAGLVEFSLTSPAPDRVQLIPTAPLPDGSWLLFWQVESADGHIVSGTLRFVVGSASAEPPTSHLRPTGVLLDRSLEALTWFAATATATAIFLRRTKFRLLAAAVLGLFALLRMASMLDLYAASAPATGEFRATAALLLLALLALAPLPSMPVHLTLTTGLFAAQGLFSGHHRATHSLLLFFAQPLHLAAALLWSAALLAILLEPSLAPRASRLATVAVAMLLPAVALLACMMLSLTDPGRWEWTVLFKILLTTAALLLGLVNHRALRRPGSDPRRLRTRTGLEVVLLLLVAIATASIATATPARPLAAGPADHNAVASSVPIPLVFDDGTTARLELSGLAPASRANGMLFLDLPSGSTVEGLSWTLSNESAGISGLSGPFLAMGDHHHAFMDLPDSGLYTVVIAATVDTFSAISATATFTVPTDQEVTS
jgi:methionine-rich copper-binding protein CopC